MTDKSKGLATIEEPTIMSLMKTAIETLDDKAVGVLERLVDLELKVDQRKAKKSFHKALREFQGECPSISKSSVANVVTKSGSKYSYKYAELDEIVKTVKPLLFHRGFSFTWDSETRDGKIKCICHLRHEDGHDIESSFEAPVPDKLGAQNEIQISSSVLTYIKRQTLVEILGLTTTDSDTDGVLPEGMEKITEGQAADIESKVVELEMNKKQFLKYFGVEEYLDICKADYKRALGVLKQKEDAS